MKMKLENSEPLSLPLCWLTSMLEQEGDVDAEPAVAAQDVREELEERERRKGAHH